MLHVVTVGCLIATGALLGRGAAYMAGVGIVALLLVIEHALVRPSDLSKLNRAFFDVNGYVSVAFFACVLLDEYAL